MNTNITVDDREYLTRLPRDDRHHERPRPAIFARSERKNQTPMRRFENSVEAGTLLAASLERFRDQPATVVAALSASAVGIALTVASSLDLPLIVVLPRTRFGSELSGRNVIVVDEGFATAQEVRDAAATVLLYEPAGFILAAPVISAEAYRVAEQIADHCFYLDLPTPFHSVGFWYDDAMHIAALELFAGTYASERPSGRRS